jgi:hypothetical protein
VQPHGWGLATRQDSRPISASTSGSAAIAHAFFAQPLDGPRVALARRRTCAARRHRAGSCRAAVPVTGLKQRFGESRVGLMAYGRTPWS